MKLKLLSGLLILLTASAAAFSLGGLFQNDTGTAALVKLSGSITPTSSGLGSGGITPEQVRNLNEKVRQGNYDAVIYEINSGGGAVVASKEIKRSIENMDIPTVCRFRDMAASGAYLIAMGCDKIVADSATITGSIGVTSSYLEFSGSLKKFGVEYVNISAGKYKEVGSRFSNASKEEKKILNDMAEDIQKEFINLVDKQRNLTDSEVSKIETAKIFLGDEAKNISLVDKLGGRGTAVDVAENLAGKNLKLKEVQTRQSFSLLSMFLSSTGVGDFLAN
ncbi:MAG: signal peptide peptidase SppA, partial [Candidatus Nanohalobium sp.]